MDEESLSYYAGKFEWRQKLIHTLNTWSENPKNLEIMQFCIEYKIPRRTLYQWSQDHPEVRKALEDARLTIACHRRIGSMNKKLDGSYAYKDMHMYDPEWHTVNKYHSDMKKEEEKQAHTFVIDMGKPKMVSKEQMQEDQNEQDK